MIHPRKPVWTEGLFMTPQHLQQSDLYHETLLHARIHAVVGYDWGITAAQFDERALSAGQFKVVKCHGVFPDGTPFFIGDRGEDQVEARPLEGAFPAALEALDVFLGIPNLRETAANISLDPAKAERLWDPQGDERVVDEVHPFLHGAGRVAIAPILLLAGVAIGYGAKRSGGCTSGNGLSGTSMYSPAALAATATFVGVAIVVSFAIRAVT